MGNRKAMYLLTEIAFWENVACRLYICRVFGGIPIFDRRRAYYFFEISLKASCIVEAALQGDLEDRVIRFSKRVF